MAHMKDVMPLLLMVAAYLRIICDVQITLPPLPGPTMRVMDPMDRRVEWHEECFKLLMQWIQTLKDNLPIVQFSQPRDFLDVLKILNVQEEHIKTTGQDLMSLSNSWFKTELDCRSEYHKWYHGGCVGAEPVGAAKAVSDIDVCSSVFIITVRKWLELYLAYVIRLHDSVAHSEYEQRVPRFPDSQPINSTSNLRMSSSALAHSHFASLYAPIADPALGIELRSREALSQHGHALFVSAFP